MKSRMIILLAIMGTVFATTKVKSQEVIFNGGADLVIPIGDFGNVASLGAGITLGAEYPLADQVSATFQLGYDFVFVKSEFSDFFSSYKMIPAQVGVKYYFEEINNGFYAHGQLGLHSLSYKTQEVAFFGVVISEGGRQSNSDVSFAFGGGTILNENIDLGLRFNIITADSDLEGASSSNYVGVRAA